jgi:hypothetical protein
MQSTAERLQRAQGRLVSHWGDRLVNTTGLHVGMSTASRGARRRQYQGIGHEAYL